MPSLPMTRAAVKKRVIARIGEVCEESGMLQRLDAHDPEHHIDANVVPVSTTVSGPMGLRDHLRCHRACFGANLLLQIR